VDPADLKTYMLPMRYLKWISDTPRLGVGAGARRPR
jgi:hypothetical protein